MLTERDIAVATNIILLNPHVHHASGECFEHLFGDDVKRNGAGAGTFPTRLYSHANDLIMPQASAVCQPTHSASYANTSPIRALSTWLSSVVYLCPRLLLVLYGYSAL
jgi:hypothetical protein